MAEATILVKGAAELAVDLETMRKLIENPEMVTRELDRLMTKHAPKRTGHLKATIYHKGNVAGAKAAYAGWVELMGGEYEYGLEAIQKFNVDGYADKIMAPLE
jgi:hypothetical protein